METRSVLQVRHNNRLTAHSRLAALEAAAASVPSNTPHGEEPVEEDLRWGGGVGVGFGVGLGLRV